MTDTIIHVGDVGTIFEVTVVENDEVTPVPIGLATVMKIYFKDPEGTKTSHTAVLVTDGSDGKMKYVGIAGDIDLAGTWQMQGYVEIPAGKFYSVKTRFTVHDNLSV